jgi:hypothetical protein
VPETFTRKQAELNSLLWTMEEQERVFNHNHLQWADSLRKRIVAGIGIAVVAGVTLGTTVGVLLGRRREAP